MGLIKQVEIRNLTSVKAGMTEFYSSESNHETILVQVPLGAKEELFVHHSQTDQILVIRGTFVLVFLQNRQYHYIAVSEYQPAIVTIPSGIPHTTLNFSDESCFVLNAVLKHGKPHKKEFLPIKPPFPVDLKAAKAILQQLETKICA